MNRIEEKVSNVIKFLGWPLSVSLQTVFRLKTHGITYSAGLFFAPILLLFTPQTTHFLIFLIVGTFVGLVWGLWTQPGKDNSDSFGLHLATFTAAMLISGAILFVLSFFHIVVIFSPFPKIF